MNVDLTFHRKPNTNIPSRLPIIHSFIHSGSTSRSCGDIHGIGPTSKPIITNDVILKLPISLSINLPLHNKTTKALPWINRKKNDQSFSAKSPKPKNESPSPPLPSLLHNHILDTYILLHHLPTPTSPNNRSNSRNPRTRLTSTPTPTPSSLSRRRIFRHSLISRSRSPRLSSASLSCRSTISAWCSPLSRRSTISAWCSFSSSLCGTPIVAVSCWCGTAIVGASGWGVVAWSSFFSSGGWSGARERGESSVSRVGGYAGGVAWLVVVVVVAVLLEMGWSVWLVWNCVFCSSFLCVRGDRGAMTGSFPFSKF